MNAQVAQELLAKEDEAELHGGRRSERRSDRHRRRKASRSRGSSSDCSSDESKFRVSSTGREGMSQRKLIARCKKHPGLLSEQLLNKMQDAVGFVGERPETDSATLPASAKAYFLRVLKNGPDLQERTVQREMQFLCSMLDHLVLRRTGEAADFVTQRLKAVERAAKNRNWDSAKFLELLPAQVETLISSDESAVMRSEVSAAKKENLANYGANSWRQDDDWQNKGAGKWDWKTVVNWNKFQNVGKPGGKKGGKKGGGKKGGKNGKRW